MIKIKIFIGKSYLFYDMKNVSFRYRLTYIYICHIILISILKFVYRNIYIHYTYNIHRIYLARSKKFRFYNWSTKIAYPNILKGYLKWRRVTFKSKICITLSIVYITFYNVYFKVFNFEYYTCVVCIFYIYLELE